MRSSVFCDHLVQTRNHKIRNVEGYITVNAGCTFIFLITAALHSTLTFSSN